jgi:thiosulfate dehydrogenase [quinone] large subunit
MGMISNYLLVTRMKAATEFVIGSLLVLGVFTAIAVFFGLALSFSYLFSGEISANPVFIILGILFVLAWRNAG